MGQGIKKPTEKQTQKNKSQDTLESQILNVKLFFSLHTGLGIRISRFECHLNLYEILGMILTLTKPQFLSCVSKGRNSHVTGFWLHITK